MKMLRTISIIFVCFLWILAVAGQSGAQSERFKAAQEAFESGEYEQTISLLDALEKSVGTSPRLESLRALAYRDLDKPREAYKALLVYFRLTEKMDLSGSDAHKSLVELRDALSSQFDTEFQNKKTELQQKRDRDAEASIEKFDSSTKKTTSMKDVDPLAELEMWNKVKLSKSANDYYLFIQRYPNGSFV